MDAQIRLFFKQLYQIIGIDTEEKHEELLFKLEDMLVRQAMARFMSGLKDSEKRQYEEFLRTHPKASNEELAEVVRSLRPGFDFGKLFNEEAQTLTEAYVKKVLTVATEEQKKQIKTVFQQMFPELISGKI